MKKIPQDIVGDIAILKFPKRTPWLIKKIKSILFLKNNKSIKTVLEKTQGFSGELRILKTKYLAGIKTKEAIYKENNCIFKFNVDETYFSPRLSNERKLIAEEILKIIKKEFKSKKHSVYKKAFSKNKRTKFANLRVGRAKRNLGGENAPHTFPKILVMFAGISPYPIVIAKKLKQNKIPAKIYSNELNKKANEYTRKNIQLNKLQDYITLIEGNAKELPKKLKQKFDIILMPRPNIKETFLKTALKLSKKGTIIFYHGFGTKEKVLSEIKKDTSLTKPSNNKSATRSVANLGAGGKPRRGFLGGAQKIQKSKISKISIRKAGDIGPRIFRWQAVFKIR